MFKAVRNTAAFLGLFDRLVYCSWLFRKPRVSSLSSSSNLLRILSDSTA
jgi:hypothetical protein